MAWKVEVTGLRYVLDTLKDLDPIALKEIKREIDDTAKRVVSLAQALTPSRPLSNWGSWNQLVARRGQLEGRDLSFDERVKGGFKVRRNNFRRRGVSAGYGVNVEQTDWAGAIFEIIGDKSRVTTPSGGHLVDVVNSRFGEGQPRTLRKAYYGADVAESADRIRDQIADAAIRLGLS